MRIAAGSLTVLLGMGFGLPRLVGIIRFRRTGEVATHPVADEAPAADPPATDHRV